MHIAKFVRLAALSAVALAGLTLAAVAADTATTTTAANLRTGPGTSFPIITSLSEGTDVTVEACTAKWCAVTTEDEDEGFVARSLLDFDQSDDDSGDDVVITPPEDDAEVCFYQQPNYKGANFCVVPGDKDADIPGSFDNNIESIRVDGGAAVMVCADTHYDSCATFNHSVNKLPLFLADEISSYKVGYDDNSMPDLPQDDMGDDDGNIIIIQ